ncbi:CLUMA_CG010530, isoform A [Clunio marinus]|uniref:CLUMA_CG010530, isoform A n=1 Tax=Clunio marinus TaxID=568069 RepID=A0A1J1IA22_9DIPT|nr:CLUMA_CG010530, isoform A [Clunio marinus]
MYSFLLSSIPRKFNVNERTFQKNEALTKDQNVKVYEDEFQRFEDMNFISIPTLHATTSTTSSSDSVSLSTEHLREMLSRDIGYNATFGIPKLTHNSIAKALRNVTRRIPVEEEINQFYFYEEKKLEDLITKRAMYLNFGKQNEQPTIKHSLGMLTNEKQSPS